MCLSAIYLCYRGCLGYIDLGPTRSKSSSSNSTVNTVDDGQQSRPHLASEEHYATKYK